MGYVHQNPDTTSPFYTDTFLQFAWDSVSIGTALSCWRKYQLAVIEGWAKVTSDSAIALTFGIAFHSGQEYYNKAKIEQNQSHDEAMLTAIRKVLLDPEYEQLPTFTDLDEIVESTPDDDDGITVRNSKIRTRYHLIRALIWYWEQYNPDPLQTIIMPTGKAAVEVSFRVPFPIQTPYGEPYILAGHIDRGVQMNNSLYVVDYKTTKSLSSQFFSSWALSHQLSGYGYAGSMVFEKPVAGILIDGIALQVGGIKLGRGPSPRSDGQMQEYFSNMTWVFTQAEILAQRLEKDPSYQYPMNTQSCYFCEYKDICRQPPEYRRRYLAMQFKPKIPWNPLENR